MNETCITVNPDPGSNFLTNQTPEDLCPRRNSTNVHATNVQTLFDPYCHWCQGATLAPFHRWGNWDSKDQVPRGRATTNMLAELRMNPAFLIPSLLFISLSASSWIVSPSLLAPRALNRAFTDEIMRLDWRLLRTKMQFLKPGHFLAQPRVSCASQHWYYHCGEQGWGRVLFNMQVNCLWQQKSRMAPTHFPGDGHGNER